MKKLIFPALLAAAVLTPATATAKEGTLITVEVSYDKEMLATAEGARAVMASIRKQAKDACSERVPATGRIHTDFECVEDITTLAAVRIVEKQDLAGLETSPVFARHAVTLVADAGQR